MTGPPSAHIAAIPGAYKTAAWLGVLGFTFAALIRGVPVVPCVVGALLCFVLLIFLRRRYPGPRVKPRRTAAVAGLAAAGTLVAFGILEAGARMLIRAPMLSPHRAEIWVHHPQAWWAPASNRDTHGVYRGDADFVEFPVRLSAQGLRGPDIAPKQADEIRVLVAGDSYTFGWAMPEGEDFASVLRRELAARAGGRPVSVVNCSAIGYGPWQERILMEERGLPLDPDVVVLQLYPANDGWNSLAKFGRAMPSYGPRMEEFVAYWRDFDHWTVRAETWLRRRSEAYHAFRILTRDYTVGIPELIARLRFVTPYAPPPLPKRTGRPPMIEQNLVEWYPELQAGWDEMEKDVLGIVARCRDLGIPLYVYAIPYPLIDPAAWIVYTRSVAAQFGAEARYAQFRDVRAAEQFLESAGIPWIPVLDPLRNEPYPDSYFIPNDGHFNEAGAKFMTDLILDRLERDGLFAQVD